MGIPDTLITLQRTADAERAAVADLLTFSLGGEAAQGQSRAAARRTFSLLAASTSPVSKPC
ncbi:hypothetical protein ABZV64_04120 [Streptomyces sp. NPDC004959]|uniref:hypothetical protein n=1 Tax=unclassified Streptomyces TaxID=2593676 RepID=UPI00131DAE12|nr:hypothetical protein [Streptomyces sp. NRRL F-5630]